MSDSCQIIVDVDATSGDAVERMNAVRAWLISEGVIVPALSDSCLGGMGHRPGPGFRVAIETDEQMFLQLRTNGVAIRTGRCVFDAGCNGIRLQCNCGHAFEPDDSYVRAVGAWAGGDDQARFPCHKCNQDRLLAEWRGPVVWGLGHLGFEFWNWPPLSEKFIAALRHKLGHRTIVVYRRL